MSKILLIKKDDKDASEIINIINDNGYKCILCNSTAEVAIKSIEQDLPDIILIDTDFENCEFLTKQIKTQTNTFKTHIILLLEKEKSADFLSFAHGYITKPVNKDILINTINSHIRIKKSLEQLGENNRELARSLYQLNVLYNTSSQFAGTLDKNKLYSIMLEAMEKTLSYDISCLLIFDANSKTHFSINSLYEPTDSLKEALALRTMVGYKNIFENEVLPHKTSLEDIEITTNVKPSHKSNIYDLRALNFDSLFAPIKVGEDFFAVVELFREKPFTKEDVTCFQSIAHQVALPLRSATLYEEIKNANIKLEKLERLKSDFISIVSHELRTPLTPINNSLEIVLTEQTGVISDDAKNFIKMAKRNVGRLSGIIEDLLDLSRIETGKLDIKYKKADLKPSLELMQKTFEQTALDKKINVSLEIDGELKEVYADVHRFEQIISNLVTNALKFTPEGGSIKICAKTLNAQELIDKEFIDPISKLQGEYIQISTIDTGIGIKKEDISKIFEKFSQIENSLNRNIGGVGLGLPITKQLVDAHLGAIWVESEENKGSNFSFIIPVFDDKKTFLMNLNRTLSSNENVGVVTIEGNLDFVNFIKNEKILKLTKRTYELEQDGKYFAVIGALDENAFNFMIKAIEAQLEQPQWQNCGIVFMNAHSKNEKDIKKIIEKIKL